MKYFDLFDDMTSARRWHIGEVLLPDGTEPRLHAGIRLDDPRPLHAKIHHMGRVLDFCLTSFAVPIATSDLAKAVTAVAGPDVQCVPVTIGGQSGRFVLNAIRVVRCLDESRSEFIKWTKDDHRPDKVGQYRQVTKTVLDRRAIPPDAHFFRIDGWRIALIVSEVVKDAMERVGCYGAEFVELEMT